MCLLQSNAIGSIADKSASLMDPINDRKAILGFQQDRTRHLLDLTTKVSQPAMDASWQTTCDSLGHLHAPEAASPYCDLDLAKPLATS